MPFPDLTTEHLLLRQLSLQDEREIFALRSDEEVNRYLDRQRAQTIEDARAFIENINKGIVKNDWYMWAVTQKGSPALIGTICLWNIVAHRSQAEIGYELLPGFQGKGIMQEAVPRIIRFGFEDMALRSIVAVLSPENLRSVKLLQKHNFVRTTEPVNDKEPVETITYILYRNQHEQQTALI